jgi:uncharacterized protein DUF5666
MQRDACHRTPATTAHVTPTPAVDARWRWATARRAVVGGGVLAAVLSLGAGVAGGSPPKGSHPPSSSSPRGMPPRNGAQPTADGKITSLSGTQMTLASRAKNAQVVTYSAATKFKTMTGTTTASSLKVGQFIAAQGTRQANGTVAATTIMISSGPPKGTGTRPPGGTHPPRQGPPAG